MTKSTPISNTKDDQLAMLVAKEMLKNDQFSALLGLKIVSASAHESVMSLDIAQHHLNGHGICHGGVYFTLADTTFAHLCNAHNQVTVAQACQISFLAPAKLGDRLVATAVKAGNSGRSGVYDIKIVRESDQQTLALFRGQSRTLSGATSGQVVAD